MQESEFIERVTCPHCGKLLEATVCVTGSHEGNGEVVLDGWIEEVVEDQAIEGG
uniref:Uncharacterized protein n=1 Tax=viral metagenome TaxID=1070528 RepID=A0A6H1ZN74_9ZZZZ